MWEEKVHVSHGENEGEVQEEEEYVKELNKSQTIALERTCN